MTCNVTRLQQQCHASCNNPSRLEEDFKIYCLKKHNTCNWHCQNKIWCCCRNGEEGDNKVLPRHMNHDYHGVDYDKDNQEEEGL